MYLGRRRQRAPPPLLLPPLPGVCVCVLSVCLWPESTCPVVHQCDVRPVDFLDRLPCQICVCTCVRACERARCSDRFWPPVFFSWTVFFSDRPLYGFLWCDGRGSVALLSVLLQEIHMKPYNVLTVTSMTYFYFIFYVFFFYVCSLSSPRFSSQQSCAVF